MQIKLSSLGKRFNYEWIFRNLSFEFVSGKAYAVLGHNGSGKSTLLSILSGFQLPSEGSVSYSSGGKEIPVDELYRFLSLAAPYQDLLEEFTLEEMIQFHTRFKPLRGISPSQLPDLLQLQAARHKLVRDFSSGMRQRLKLGLALYSETPLLLLDEPTTNLDQAGVAWYLEHLDRNRQNRLVLIGSNVPHEYSFCDEQLPINEFHYKAPERKKH
ncbi:ATP-binding cassette domain-containing protein [Rufibacter glacialis]|uniref:ABC transporter ATP-binding protein n=1 Tax=Rufibacter glacialis TaxID=1259555 RepID=A0A5M8QHN0_9BACT|nr:ABC transporter ATP-binding protein [Rufibacter glacialis]KAA6435597.1 ABC transporter ATP-binding protein [Rufibacter glacialis]GGK64867.1 heme ABC exporter ATP-binding protein CcmA [Rufibacter glacialis]